MQYHHAKHLTVPDQWFRIWMPYTFVNLEAEGVEHVYLPLNRNYKPLGMRTKDWVDHRDYIDQAVVFPAGPHTFENVWHNLEKLRLYDDIPNSRSDYFARLDRLFSRPVKLFPQFA